MECLDASRLFDLFAASPRGGERDRADEHLDRCDRCRALVAAYARVADDGGADDTIALEGPTELGAPRGEGATSARAAARFTAGDVVARRFRLEHVVGEGGMGVVWAARALDGEARAALKIIRVHTPEHARRAAREARVSSLIGHPNVLEVRELITIAGEPPILVMDLLDGESLDRLLARRRTLSVAEALAILVPLVGTVRAAHARGVLHRDLKPQNVFLAQDGAAEPVVMLLDFGLAKVVGQDIETLTRSGAVVGTPHYMAPEQLYGEADIDRRADVWAIGVVAYECLTGRRPLEGGSYGQLVRNATRRAMRPAAELLPDAPRALVALIDRMLAHDREGRPELAEVHAALDGLARCG